MEVLIIGAGGHAKVVADAIEQEGIHRIIGFVDEDQDRLCEVYGYPVVGGMEVFKEKRFSAVNAGILAVGDNGKRKLLAERISQIRASFVFITVTHPAAVLSRGVKVGHGTIIMPGAIVKSDTCVGNHCVINSNCSLGHDTSIGDFVTIGPGALVGGHVKIGDCSMVSLGANVIHNIEIGEQTIIGSGATVVNHIGSGVIACGIPAKVTRKRETGEKYL